MSTIRFIAPTMISGVTPVWIWGGYSSTSAVNQRGGIGEMISLGNGYIVLRNSDAYLSARPNIYEAFGPGGIQGQTKATTDAVIMPNAGTLPINGAFPLTFGLSTSGAIAFNAPASTVSSTLNGLASIVTAGGVTVTGPNGGPYTVTFVSNGFRAAFQSGQNTFASIGNFTGVVIIKTVQPGTASTPNIQTITPAIVQGQAAALLINAAGQVDFTSLGTFITPTILFSQTAQMTTIGGIAQYASLATSMAPVVISGTSCIFCGGIFQSYYYKGSATAMQSLALIDMSAKAVRAGFAGGTLIFNPPLNQTLAPKVFSDGAASFGISSPGTGFGYNGDLTGNYIWTYNYTFGSTAGQWQPSGTGTLVSITVSGVPSFTPPIAKYRGTGFNGPILIGADGSIAATFAVARFSIATPVKKGSVFIHDSILQRPQTDLPPGNIQVGINQVGGVATMTFVGPDGGTYNMVGGSIYGWAQGTFNGSNEIASLAGMFPDCSVAFVSTSSISGTRTTVATVTLPANATYVISLALGGATNSGNMPQFLCISSSDGAMNIYYPTPFNQNGTGTNVSIVQSAIGSTAMAVQGSQICHVMHFVPSNNPIQNFANINWGISIPGVGRINVSINAAQGSTGKGTGAGSSNGYNPLPVSVVPFNGGFAIALPHSPASNIGTPYKYTWSPAKAGATTILLKSPIILIDASGNPNTSFDANLYANFFSLAATIFMRYGPLSLMVANGHLYFGSFYVPSYLSATGANRQIDGLGGIIIPPVWGPPFQNGLLPLEVLCACDASGNQVLPAAHP